MSENVETTETQEPQLLKVDFGCGPNTREGFVGVDSIPFDGVKYVFDAAHDTWPFEDNSIDEANASHFLEHLDQPERIVFLNTLWDKLKNGGKATIICPHWCSQRAYGDPTHKWPPLGYFFFLYLLENWRESNAPHSDAKHLDWGYRCNFESTSGVTIDPEVQAWNPERQQYAMKFLIEATPDIIVTITKRPLGWKPGDKI